jgi:DNA transformation protein
VGVHSAQAAAHQNDYTDAEFIGDLVATFRPVTLRRTFRGAGLYADGLIFALMRDGAIYLNSDDASIPLFERDGSRPFIYTQAKSRGRIGRASLSCWLLPERLYDEP